MAQSQRPYFGYHSASQEYGSDDYRVEGPIPPPKEPPSVRTHQVQPSHNATSYASSGKESQMAAQSDLDFYSATPVKNPQSSNSIIWNKVSWGLRWILTTGAGALILSIPIFLFRDDKDSQDGTKQERQVNNLVFFIFCWVVTAWVSACIGHLLALFFPYIFRFFAQYINPAHKKYWKVFRRMKWPFTFVGASTGSIGGFYYVRHYITASFSCCLLTSK